jgi:hypothetical protein
MVTLIVHISAPLIYFPILILSIIIYKIFKPDEKLNTGKVLIFTYTDMVIDDEMKEHSCSICLIEYVDNDILKYLSCRHYFHKECIDRWTVEKNNCPICRNVA